MSRPDCPKCFEGNPYKYGTHHGHQRWKCKYCHYQFTRPEGRGPSLEDQIEVVRLYSSGVSFRRTGRMKGISHTTVRRWVKDFAQHELPDKPEVTSPVTAIQMDEQWHFLQKTSQALAVEGH